MKSLLQGCPEVRIIVGDELFMGENAGGLILEDINFNECVKSRAFDPRDHSLQFSPPEGEFSLFNYRTSTTKKLPFRIRTSLEELPNRLEVTLWVGPVITFNIDNILAYCAPT
jgi:AP-4 complex subunit mu-1